MAYLNAKKLIEELSSQNAELIKHNTALQLSKHKLENESEKLNQLYDLTALGYLVLDSKAKIVQYNDKVAKLIGYSFSELLHSNFSSYIVNEDLPEFSTFLLQAKETKLKHTCTVKLISNKKQYYFVSLNALYLEKEQHYIIALKNSSTKEDLKNKLKVSNFQSEKMLSLGIFGSYKLNVTTGIWDVCDMVRNIFGVKKDFCFNFDSWVAMIHPDDKSEMESYLLHLIKDKATCNKEYRIIRISDRKVRWIESNGEIIVDAKTNELVLFGIIQDITNIKLATDKIKIAELHSNSIFKSSTEGILILDADSQQITDANPSLIKMIGYDYEELLGKKLWEIGFFKNIEASKEAFLELQQNEYIRFENMPLLTKMGLPLDVEFVINMYWVDHKKIILCHIRDISDRKKTEEALKLSRQFYFAMFEKNQAVQLLIDPIEGQIIDANSAAAQFYGYTLAQLITMNLSDISIFPKKKIIEELGKFGLAGQSYFQFKHKLASGEICDIEIYTSPLQIEGKPYLISTINNITKRIIKEDELKLVYQQLKDANAIKSQFISTVSHEFRTPLAGIQSSVQLLQIYHDTWGKEKIEKMYKQIFNAIQQTKLLLDDVNLIDNEQNSESFFRPVFIELTPLINEIIDENLAVSNTKHKVVLKSSFKKECFFIDPVIVRHILNNLLSNAIKYSPENKIIRITVDEFNKNELKITIKDQGIGIPKEEIKYLTEPFYRASNHGEVKGTGFGMSIVKRFVELHKGQLFFESILNEGTTVTIILPFKRQEI